MLIEYINGDATDAIPSVYDKKTVIAHCCNDVGAWGSGFVVALSNKWQKTGFEYQQWAKNGFWHENHRPFKLGQYQFVDCGNETYVANIIGQSGCVPLCGLPPVRYGAIHEGFIRLREDMGRESWGLHMPRMGCGLAGGDWKEIERILHDVFQRMNLHIRVYDYHQLGVGDVVKGNTYHPLACGSGQYEYAMVVSIDPFVLVSEHGDMMWTQKQKGSVSYLHIATDEEMKAAFARFEQSQKI